MEVVNHMPTAHKINGQNSLLPKQMALLSMLNIVLTYTMKAVDHR